MVTITIDSHTLEVDESLTILEAAQQLCINIPTLCYLKNFNTMGACRMCVVELEGLDRLVSACNTPVQEGMVIHTQSPRIDAHRRLNLEIMDSRHDRNCASCHRNGSCKFLDLLLYYNIDKDLLPKKLMSAKRAAWPAQSIVQKDHNKCVSCGRCVQVCKKIQGTNVWNFIGSGSLASVDVKECKTMPEAGCVSCGQCITHCVDGALKERDDTKLFKEALADPQTTVIVQIAPAVRTAWASTKGFEDGHLTCERIAAALKALGADLVFDTIFGADMTIMEEASELVQRLSSNNSYKLPLFTSCCPAWMTHARNKHDDLLDTISSAKSPMLMFGAAIKDWYAKKHNLNPARIFSVAIMPCTAKKQEIELPGSSSHPGINDLNLSLTTRELVRMLDEEGINLYELEDVPLDNPLGQGSGAGTIFGVTGGVMEAALRSAYYFVTHTNPPADMFVFKESEYPWHEAEFKIQDITVRCAFVSGLVNTDKLIELVKKGVCSYDFVEVMACPGGCSGGGGQPIDGTDRELGLSRGSVLRRIDKEQSKIRYCHENPQIQQLFSEWLGDRGSKKAHQFLHVNHRAIKAEYDISWD